MHGFKHEFVEVIWREQREKFVARSSGLGFGGHGSSLGRAV